MRYEGDYEIMRIRVPMSQDWLSSCYGLLCAFKVHIIHDILCMDFEL